MSKIYRLKPLRSNIMRQNFLFHMKHLIERAPFELEPYLSQKHISELKDLLEHYFKAEECLRQFREKRRNLAQDLDQSILDLSKAVRDAWAFAQRSLYYAGYHPKDLDYYYGAKLSTKMEKNRAQEDWANAAKRLLKRETMALCEGLPALVAPSATQLRQLLEPVDSQLSIRRWLMLEVSKLEASVYALRQRLDWLHRDIYAYIRFNHRDVPAASRRVICRGLGFSFRSVTNKKRPKPEPEEVKAAQ